MISRTYPLVLPNDDGMRAVGPPDECFYCHQKVGTPHGHDCVAIHRKVKVRYIFEIDIEVPYHWEEDMILFSRNEGGWCAGNAFNEINAAIEDSGGGCPCSIFTCEVVDIPDAEPYGKEAP